jgi:hypothetical protein
MLQLHKMVNWPTRVRHVSKIFESVCQIIGRGERERRQLQSCCICAHLFVGSFYRVVFNYRVPRPFLFFYPSALQSVQPYRSWVCPSCSSSLLAHGMEELVPPMDRKNSSCGSLPHHKRGPKKKGKGVLNVYNAHVYIVYQVCSPSTQWEPHYPGSRSPNVSSGKCDQFPVVKASGKFYAIQNIINYL